MRDQRISFGDNVRIRDTPATQAAGVAGLTGPVHGETTPSVTGVEVIGEPDGDYAIAVHFEERGEALWFAPDLLEFVDHGAGAEITIKGVDRKWTRTESGEWEESPTDGAGKKRTRVESEQREETPAVTRYKSFWQRLTGRKFRKQ